MIEVSEGNSTCLVRPRGKIDSNTAPEFQAAMMRIVEGGPSNLIVDLEQVPFMASAGLRAILTVAKRLKASDLTFRVFGLNGLVRETFEISGFVSIIDVRETEAEAREGLA